MYSFIPPSTTALLSFCKIPLIPSSPHLHQTPPPRLSCTTPSPTAGAGPWVSGRAECPSLQRQTVESRIIFALQINSRWLLRGTSETRGAAPPPSPPSPLGHQRLHPLMAFSVPRLRTGTLSLCVVVAVCFVLSLVCLFIHQYYCRLFGSFFLSFIYLSVHLFNCSFIYQCISLSVYLGLYR